MKPIAYKSYQPTGSTWPDAIPSHWSLRRTRYLATLKPSAREIGLNDDDWVSFVPMDAVGEYGGLRLDQEKQLGAIGDGYTYFSDGDVVIAKITPCFENGKGASAEGLSNGVAFGTTELHVVRAGPELDRRFLFYLTISRGFRTLGEASMYGAGGQKRVPELFIKDLRMPVPPLDEQNTIVRFLDTKTAEIDALITKKRRVLELLGEQRVALITHAVTKGLDPTVAFQPSGLPWFGSIPRHWQVKRLKHVTSNVVDCLHTTPTYDGELVYPAIRTADVAPGVVNLESALKVSEEVFTERIQRLKPEGGDIVYSREGERFGMAALVPEGVELCLGQRMMMFRVHPQHSSHFFMWALNSDPIFKRVKLYSLGATSPHVNIADIINFEFPCPPGEEQAKIARHIQERVSRTDPVALAVQKAIESLAAHRSALITAAVTGQIDVRNWSAKRAAA